MLDGCKHILLVISNVIPSLADIYLFRTHKIGHLNAKGRRGPKLFFCTVAHFFVVQMKIFLLQGDLTSSYAREITLYSLAIRTRDHLPSVGIPLLSFSATFGAPCESIRLGGVLLLGCISSRDGSGLLWCMEARPVRRKSTYLKNFLFHRLGAVHTVRSMLWTSLFKTIFSRTSVSHFPKNPYSKVWP